MQKRHFLLLALLLLSGCSDSSDGLDFSIVPVPSRGHAPVTLSFTLERDDALSVGECTASWDFGDGVSMSGSVEAEHRYKRPGTFTVTADIDCGSKSGSSATDVVIYDEIDLSLASLTARPLDVSTDGSLEASVQVSNLNDSALRIPTNLDFYLTTSSDLSRFEPAASTRILRHVLTSFPAASDKDSTQKLDFSIPISSSLRTGTYHLAAVINPKGETGESNLDNNVAMFDTALTVRNQATDGADLKAVRLQMSPAVTSILTSATASFDLLNLGSTTAESFGYEIWLGSKDNADNMDGATLVSSSVIEGSVSGTVQTFQDVLVSVTPAVSEPGLYYFWLIIDPDDKIVERDETNNTVRSTSPIQVTNEPVLNADIIVEAVTFSPATASRGNTFSTVVDVYNQGSQPTGSFICTIFLSGDMSLDVDKDKIVGSINVDDLQPTSALSLTTSVQVDESIVPGSYYVYAFCDSSGVITEANEDNNIQRSNEQIAITATSSVDLLLSQVSSFSPETPSDGDQVLLQAQLCNNGSTGAGPSVVSVMRQNLCDSSKVEVARQTVESVESNSCIPLMIPFRQVCDFWCPRYALTLTADATNVLNETNENNNSLTLEQTLVTGGTDCVCHSDQFEPNNTMTIATLAASLNDDLTLCPGDADWFKLDITNGESFRAHVFHDYDRSPLKLELWQNDDLLRGYAGSADLYMEAERVADADAAPLYLLVQSDAPGEGNHYHIDLETYSAPAPSGIDIAASNLTVENGRLSVAEWRTVSVQIDNLSNEAVSGLRIGYYLSQTGQIDETATKLATQTVDTVAPNVTKIIDASLKIPSDTPSATYHLVVKADDDNALNDVRPSNNIARSTGWVLDKSCWDTLDPNESFETAATVVFTDATFAMSGLHVCKTNDDYYRFDVLNGTSLEITATAASYGDFDMVLYDSHFNEITASRTSSATETIKQDVIVGNQTLYLRIFLLDNTYNADEIVYSLSIESKPAAEWLTCNAAAEPNGFFSSAASLREVSRSGETLAVCPATDEDYYQIELLAGERLQVGFETDSPRLRASLYGGEEHRFIAMLTNLANQKFDYTATADSTFWIRVFTNASEYTSQSYRVLLKEETGLNYGLSSLALAPETPIAGQPATAAFSVTNLSDVESAWAYRLRVISASHSEILYTSSVQSALAANETAHFRHKVTLPASISGNADFRVELMLDDDVDQSNNIASKTLNIVTACSADIYEPNDTALSAKSLTNAPVLATICEGDEDWYTLHATSDQIISLYAVHDSGDLDLYVYDASGQIVAKSVTANDNESVRINSDQKIYILVKGADSSIRNNYTLSF